MKNAQTEKKEINFVHQEKILAETVRKENSSIKLNMNFGLNPYKKVYALTEKPNVISDNIIEDENFKRWINCANLEPTKKYDAPMTSNQEYGWISQSLIEVDRTDTRLFFTSCEITRFMKFDSGALGSQGRLPTGRSRCLKLTED